ncbi:uncharacterized protein [Rutidosis leptorrhynchoides]|uniref:uncharacterized protein n=1 Tax=Rutidosis leptorrhynchoides TaxID=125765 RepID=UPI003A99566D
MTFSEKGLFNLVNISDLKLTVEHPNGTQALIKSIGNLKINNHITLFDVLVVPEYCASLISVYKLSRDNKISIRFDDKKCYIQDLKDLKIKGTGRQDGGLFFFDNTDDPSFTANNCVSNYASGKLWHARLGHPSDKVLNVLKTKLSFKDDLNTEPCEICHKAKQTRLPFPLSEQKTTSLGELIHLDFWGPFKIQSREGIVHQTTCAYTPQQNGVVERTPTAVLNGKSPYELIFKTEPNLSYIKCFGACVFQLFLILLINLVADVKFYETVSPLKLKTVDEKQNDNDLYRMNFFDQIFLRTNDTSSPYDEERSNSDGDGSSDHDYDPTATHEHGSSDNPNEHSPTATHESEQNSHSEGNSLNLQNTSSFDNLRRSTRSTVFPKKFDDFIVDDKVKYSINRVANYSNLNSNNLCFISNLNKSYEPKNYDQAVKDPNWVEAMNTEIEALNRMQNNCPLFQLDINNAFLYGDLNDEVYMTLPQGYYSNSDKKNKVCKLTKSLYGLKQAPTQWNEKLNSALFENGFTQRVKPIGSPIEPNLCVACEPSEKDHLISNLTEYQKLVGRLIYLTLTRPDISFVVHVLSQYMHAPLQSHLNLAFRVLRYLKGSPGKGLHLMKGNDFSLCAYSDSDWGKCPLLKQNIGPWQQLLIASNPVFHERTKHFDIDVHFIRDKVCTGVIKTERVDSQNQLADILTKGLSIRQHHFLVE